MKNNIRFLKFNNYLNKNLSNYLSDNENTSITVLIEYIKDNFIPDEVVPTLINLIDYEISSKKLILYLDLINFFISRASYLKLKSLKSLVFDRCMVLLANMTVTENRSIIYQFLIDFSALYEVDINKLKSRFPIDRYMFLKRVVELASSKGYLRFLLMYEVAVFFTKNELNYMWPDINLFTQEQKVLFFNIFIASFDYKKQKKIFKFIASSSNAVKSKFIPTLNFYFPEKRLYFKNILNLTDEDFDRIMVRSPGNSFYSQAYVYFSQKKKSFLFSLSFFEYKRYTLILELDFNLKVLNVSLIKQPILFSSEFFINNFKSEYPYRLRIDIIAAKEFYEGLLFTFDKTTDIPLMLSLVNYFTFKNTVIPEDYKFLTDKNLVVNHFQLDKGFLNLLIENNLHCFVDYSELFPENISHKKDNIKAFLYSPLFIKKFDKYINDNKEDILGKIRLFAEFSKSLTNKKKLINYFIILYKELSEKEAGYIKVDYLMHLFLFYFSHKDEVES